MAKINLRWVGALFDSSGYASASRSYVQALLQNSEVDLTLGAATFETTMRTSHGPLQETMKGLLNKPLAYKMQVVHLTPENYAAMKEKDKYNIAYTTWETDKLPHGWVEACNSMDEIWVPSSWNKKCFASSGVTKPIVVVPHCVPPMDMTDAIPLETDLPEDTYCFYSIFQWLERKNPIGLLKAYLSEFKANENVCLLIKSYRLDSSVAEQDIIKQDIANTKQAMRLKEYPQMRFFGTLLSSTQMKGLHARGNCFVLPHRAEGFGIPLAESMLLGKPTISSGYSGNLDFMDNSNSFLIPCQETPVYNMIFPHYDSSMTWGDPDISKLKKLMRYCFEHRAEAAKRAAQGKKDIEERYNLKAISSIIVDRLKEIEGKL